MPYDLFKYAQTPGDIRDIILDHCGNAPMDTYIASNLASSIYTKIHEEKRKMCLICARQARKDHEDGQ